MAKKGCLIFLGASINTGRYKDLLLLGALMCGHDLRYEGRLKDTATHSVVIARFQSVFEVSFLWPVVDSKTSSLSVQFLKQFEVLQIHLQAAEARPSTVAGCHQMSTGERN